MDSIKLGKSCGEKAQHKEIIKACFVRMEIFLDSMFKFRHRTENMNQLKHSKTNKSKCWGKQVMKRSPGEQVRVNVEWGSWGGDPAVKEHRHRKLRSFKYRNLNWNGLATAKEHEVRQHSGNEVVIRLEALYRSRWVVGWSRPARSTHWNKRKESGHRKQKYSILQKMNLPKPEPHCHNPKKPRKSTTDL